MRNLELIDAVVALHEIARLVDAETGNTTLSNTIRDCANTLHNLSIEDRKNSELVNKIINKAKE